MIGILLEGSDARKSSYIPTLDGWRAVAIILVIFSHIVHLPVLVHVGPFGVGIFFAISGHLICTLLLRERSRNGSISLREFYTRRAFRIFPVAVTCLVVTFLVGLAGLPDILRCLFFAANYLQPGSRYLGHFWSLSLEEHFYVLWPALLVFLGNRRAAIFAGISIPVVLVWRAWALTHATGGIFYERTDIRLDVFLAPCLLAIVLHESPAWRERFRRRLSPMALAASAGLLIGSYFISMGAGYIEVLRKTIQALVIPLLVTGTVLNPQTWVGRLLELAPLRFIGRISYSLYLWHVIALWAPPWPLWERLLLALVAAVTTYYAIEKPFIRAGKHHLMHASTIRVAAPLRDHFVRNSGGEPIT